jgi:hypothetical protein
MAANTRKIVEMIIKGDSRSAEGSMRRLGAGMSGLQRAAGALGIAMSAGAFVAITKRSLDTADAIAKQSAQANIASGTYQELVFALDKFDITQEAVAKGLKTFTKQLGEARLGAGTLTTILGRYDKALLDNITSVGSNEAALNIYLKALGNVKNDADRAALAAAGFGRTAGVDMANALKDGGKGIDDWRKKARDLGIVLDDDLLKGAEGAKDQLSALATALNVRLTAAVIELAPQIDQLTQNLIKVLPPLTEFLINLTSLGEVGLGTGFQSDIESWQEQLKTAQSEVDNLRSAITQLESPSSPSQPKVLEQLNAQLLLAEKNVIRLKRQFLVNDKPRQLGGAIQTPAPDPVVPVGIDEEAIRKAAEAADKLAGENFRARIEAMSAQSQEAEKLRASLEAIRISQLGWAQTVIESLETPTEKIQNYRKELDEALARGDLSLAQHGQAYQNFADSVLGVDMGGGFWENWLASAEQSFTDFDQLTANVAENFSANMGSAFEKMIFDATSVQDAVGMLAQGMARSMVNAIGQMAAQWLVLQMVRKTADTTAQLSAAATMTANAQAMSAMAGLNAFSSTAAIPIVGPAAAPAAAAAAIAATQPMALTVSSLMLAGMAHDGLDSVPKAGTWFLDKGERVTTEKTSAKLDRTLDDVKASQQQPTAQAPQNIRIINAFDVGVVGDYLGSDAGERKIMNVIRRNPSIIKQAVG